MICLSYNRPKSSRVVFATRMRTSYVTPSTLYMIDSVDRSGNGSESASGKQSKSRLLGNLRDLRVSRKANSNEKISIKEMHMTAPASAPAPATIAEISKAKKDSTSSFQSDENQSIKSKADRVIKEILDDADDDEDLGDQGTNFQSGFVSILGNPNVGKSTLMNAILGQQLCIVSPKPQTTRHRILGVLTQPTYQLIFSDTPGMVAPAYKLQEVMMESVKGAAGDADAIVVVSDVYGEPLIDDTITRRLNGTDKPIIIAVNKIDLVGGVYGLSPIQNVKDMTGPRLERGKDGRGKGNEKGKSKTKGKATDVEMEGSQEGDNEDDARGEVSQSKSAIHNDVREFLNMNERADAEMNDNQGANANGGNKETFSHPRPFDELVEIWSKRFPQAKIIPISAANNLGVKELISALVSNMPLGPKYFSSNTLTNRNERFFSAEIIREVLFHTYQDEVPYSCEVVIDSFKDKSERMSVIEATIIVNKSSQKAILIGKQGAKLKELGIAARTKLQEFLQRQVYLSLHVKVNEDWRTNEDALTRFGYIEDDFQ